MGVSSFTSFCWEQAKRSHCQFSCRAQALTSFFRAPDDLSIVFFFINHSIYLHVSSKQNLHIWFHSFIHFLVLFACLSFYWYIFPFNFLCLFLSFFHSFFVSVFLLIHFIFLVYYLFLLPLSLFFFHSLPFFLTQSHLKLYHHQN